jgi:uncharacterized lipoprotein NlpE involved in copper resistance
MKGTDMKKISVIVLLLIMLLLVACNSNESASTGDTEVVENLLEAQLIGEWKYYKSLEGLTDEMDYIIHFKKDETYISTGHEKVKNLYAAGQWSLTGDVLSLNHTEQSNQLKVKIEIKDNQLFIKNANGENKDEIRNRFYAEREYHQEIYDKIE